MILKNNTYRNRDACNRSRSRVFLISRFQIDDKRFSTREIGIINIIIFFFGILFFKHIRSHRNRITLYGFRPNIQSYSLCTILSKIPINRSRICRSTCACLRNRQRSLRTIIQHDRPFCKLRQKLRTIIQLNPTILHLASHLCATRDILLNFHIGTSLIIRSFQFLFQYAFCMRNYGISTYRQ